MSFFKKKSQMFLLHHHLLQTILLSSSTQPTFSFLDLLQSTHLLSLLFTTFSTHFLSLLLIFFSTFSQPIFFFFFFSSNFTQLIFFSLHTLSGSAHPLLFPSISFQSITFALNSSHPPLSFPSLPPPPKPSPPPSLSKPLTSPPSNPIPLLFFHTPQPTHHRLFLPNHLLPPSFQLIFLFSSISSNQPINSSSISSSSKAFQVPTYLLIFFPYPPTNTSTPPPSPLPPKPSPLSKPLLPPPSNPSSLLSRPTTYHLLPIHVLLSPPLNRSPSPLLICRILHSSSSQSALSSS